jgi:alkanesulfonate monooxygenase SsuD/methylene tetrahydromethanopterin reductase-like flavin-dependent oxidoreductase (luciferase family)
VRFGFVVPSGDAADVADMAEVAEQAGWDGLFVWEALYGVDAWVSLGAAAVRTKTLRLGTLLTPVSRRKPWELAGQVATVDRLSGGRVTLSVGLGALDSGFANFGEVCDRRTRAELMDESLEIMNRLWTGQPVAYSGQHYTVTPSDFPTLTHVVQQPHPPVWCVGALGSQKSMARALRCDGLIPQVVDNGEARQATLEELIEAMPSIRSAANGRPYDVIVEGSFDEHSPAAWFEAGATWWIESLWDAMHGPDPVGASMDRLRAGPPAIA